MDLERLLEVQRWEAEPAVDCVACPDCAFTFDSFHTDRDGGHSCPACAELRLREILATQPSLDLDDLLLIRDLLQAAPEPPADLVARIKSAIAANGV